jgi:hypothetical protein
MTRILPALLLLATSIPVWAQSGTTTSQPTGTGGLQPIDACGTLVEGAGCVLFEGGGGTFVITPSGDFHFGDAVRVVGTIDPHCITICHDNDGCIRGAVLYDPAVLPCGTALPNFPGDIVAGVCSTLSSSLLALTLVGLVVARWRAPRPRAH